MLYHWLGWIAAALWGAALLRYLARKSKRKTFNKIAHNLHIPASIATFALGLWHGVLSKMAEPTMHLANRTGALLLLAFLLLVLTYGLRKLMKKTWFPLHRLAAAVSLGILIWHIAVSL